MGLFGEVRRNFVARPEFAKGTLVYLHPDNNIRKGTELTVGADESVLFVKDGKVAGTMGPGRHTLTTDEVPFLGMLIDAATGGNLYISQLYFVTTREVPDVKFGGPIGNLQDPQSQLIVSTGVYGDLSVKVTNPEQLVIGLIGLRQASNDDTLAWFKQLFLRVIKETVAELIVKKGWTLLQVTSGAYTEDICTETLKRTGPVIDKYGLTIANLANFHVSVKDEDLQQLKNFARDVAMSKMAGGFQGYAMGEAMMHGGGGGGGASGLDMMGMAMAQQMMKNMPGAAAPAAPAPAGAAAATDAADGNSAKARLAKLKGLLADELITPEEFEAKKKEILSSI